MLQNWGEYDNNQNKLQKHKNGQRSNVITVILATHVKSVQFMEKHVWSVGIPTTSKHCVGATRAEGVQCMK